MNSQLCTRLRDMVRVDGVVHPGFSLSQGPTLTHTRHICRSNAAHHPHAVFQLHMHGRTGRSGRKTFGKEVGRSFVQTRVRVSVVIQPIILGPLAEVSASTARELDVLVYGVAAVSPLGAPCGVSSHFP